LRPLPLGEGRRDRREKGRYAAGEQRANRVKHVRRLPQNDENNIALGQPQDAQIVWIGGSARGSSPNAIRCEPPPFSKWQKMSTGRHSVCRRSGAIKSLLLSMEQPVSQPSGTATFHWRNLAPIGAPASQWT
jgi:hypothetical protein